MKFHTGNSNLFSENLIFSDTPDLSCLICLEQYIHEYNKDDMPLTFYSCDVCLRLTHI